MKVALTVASTPHWESVAEHIEGYKTTHLENTPQESDTLVLTDACTVDQLAEAINNTAISTMVVFYQQAEHYLAEAVSQGASFENAAEQWQRTTNHLLQIQRKNRARLKLINIEQAMAAPQAFSEQLASLKVITAKESAGSAQPDVTLLAACQYVAQETELLQINNLLQASSLLLKPDNKIALDIESIVGEYDSVASRLAQLACEIKGITSQNNRLQCAIAACEVNLKNATEEKNFLFNQLHQVQEELEKTAIERASNEAAKKAQHLKLQESLEQTQVAHELENNRLLFDLDARTKERDVLHDKQELLVAQLSESVEENSLLHTQLHHVQEELKNSIFEKESLEESSKAERVKSQQLLEKIAAINNAEKLDNNKVLADLSVKISEQGTQKEKYQQLANQLKESNEENALLLTQLHLVQEELERIFLSKKETVQQKQLKREIIKLEHKLRNTTADLASKNYRLSLVLQEVADMKASIFWKTGAPIRAVSQALNKSKNQRKKIENDIELILSSEFFDAEWYLAQYPDVAESTISPAEHYLSFGAAEQRFPGPLFSGAWYTYTYSDVADSGINPLLHYIKFGKAEGRTASLKLLQDQSKSVGEV